MNDTGLCETKKAPDRLAVLEKIANFEKKELFDKDVESDPVGRKLFPHEVDYLKKNIMSKIKSKIAYFFANKFISKMIKTKNFILDKVEGLENVKDIDGGFIITCNHFNPLDSFAVQLGFAKAGINDIYTVIKEGNYTGMKGFYGFLMRNCNTLPLSENIETMQKFLDSVGELLENKKHIMIYPEQSMWWNYKKPRPTKIGAFKIASKFFVPIVPCFISMEDSEVVGRDGFYVQKYRLHIGKPIFPNEKYSAIENAKKLQAENEQVWQDVFNKAYLGK